MQTSTMRKAKQLPPEAWRAVESLLGRVLDEDETVRVSASQGRVVKEGPQGEAKLAAGKKLTEFLQDVNAGAPDIPAEEVDELVDEAIAYARGHRRRESHSMSTSYC